MSMIPNRLSKEQKKGSRGVSRVLFKPIADQDETVSITSGTKTCVNAVENVQSNENTAKTSAMEKL